MQTSLDLQQALFRHQQRQIDALVAGASKPFKAYEARYRRASRAVRRVISLSELHRRVAAADVVHVGDYHTLRFAQRAFVDLLKHALQTGRRVVVALEFVEGRHQHAVDEYLAGRLTDRAFLDEIGHPYSGAFDIWPHFKPIFELARRRRLELVAIDKRATGPKSLPQRDAYAARRIADAARADDRPLVLVLMGQYHVAPAHLPAEVTRALGAHARRQLVVFQNPEGAWWKLARAGQVDAVDAIELSDDVLALFNASPIVCQRTFLDYCEAEAGDAPVDDGGLAGTVRTLAREIARLTGVRIKDQLARLEVLTPNELDVLDRLRRRGGFSKRELGELEQHVLSGQSAFIPRANAIWLSGFSLNHAAEEAAHFVRHCAVGSAMEQSRRRTDAFWARCVEEAIAFFGSKLVNPRRTCTSLTTWASHFLHDTPGLKATAAFVLALSSAPDVRHPEVRRLVPTGLEQFTAVTHAMGYLLGAALFEAH
ncbi:MAG: ChaN family lipoprotein, partial [Myxococcaceae bacterium]|nr:ChaN family lipoprotein [Myxococcaceae bacterium]